MAGFDLSRKPTVFFFNKHIEFWGKLLFDVEDGERGRVLLLCRQILREIKKRIAEGMDARQSTEAECDAIAKSVELVAKHAVKNKMYLGVDPVLDVFVRQIVQQVELIANRELVSDLLARVSKLERLPAVA